MVAANREKTMGGDPAVGDRRRHARYRVHHSSLLYNSDNLAEVLNISSGGVACKRIIDMQNTAGVVSDLELLNCEIGEYVQGLSCRRVRTGHEFDDNGLVGSETPDCFFEFINLSEKQVNDLGQFIKRSSHGPAPMLIFFNNSS